MTTIAQDIFYVEQRPAKDSNAQLRKQMRTVIAEARQFASLFDVQLVVQTMDIDEVDVYLVAPAGKMFKTTESTEHMFFGPMEDQIECLLDDVYYAIHSGFTNVWGLPC